jgi:hypothetical protein
MVPLMVDKAHEALNKLGTIVHGLDAIEGIAKLVLGNPAQDAFEALHVIAVIVDTVRAGFHDKLTAEAVEKEITSLRITITGNDAAADQALNDKFDKG